MQVLPKARVIGTGILELRGRGKGPTIGIISNVHGNEPCGRRAFQRVLRSHEIERGRLILVDGNPDASLLGRRFVDADMNRMFTQKKLNSKSRDQDLARARYLADTLPKIGMDLAIDFHSVTSRTAHPFTISFDGTEDLAELCPTPRIYGWRGIVKGTLCEWLCDHGTPTVVVEAGQHEATSSVRWSEKTILSVLSNHGLIELEKPLKNRSQRSYDVIENVQISDRDSFVFSKVYGSFDKLEPGEVIARDKTRTYQVPDHPGYVILMPTTPETIRERTASGAYYLMKERSAH